MKRLIQHCIPMFMRAQVGKPVRCTATPGRHMTRFRLRVVSTGLEVERTSFA